MKEFLVGLAIMAPFIVFIGFLIWLYDRNEEKFRMVVAGIFGTLVVGLLLTLLGTLTYELGNAVLNGIE